MGEAFSVVPNRTSPCRTRQRNFMPRLIRSIHERAIASDEIALRGRHSSTTTLPLMFEPSCGMQKYP